MPHYPTTPLPTASSPNKRRCTLNALCICPVQIAYVAPSVTPFTDINPSFRVYEYAVKATQEVTDVHQYRIDLETANKAGSGGPSWDLAYTATSYYGLPDATAASWDALARRMLNASAVAPGDTGSYC